LERHRTRGHPAHTQPGGIGDRGWGFGYRSFLNDQQGYTWAGEPIAPTVFEIAVTAGPLSLAERKLLLAQPKP
jgi:hypothetical protein